MRAGKKRKRKTKKGEIGSRATMSSGKGRKSAGESLGEKQQLEAKQGSM